MKEYKIKPKDTIYELIRSKIINKELFPNSQIVESQLAFETGISRTPIREALKRLDYEGIVTIIPNRGAYISNPTLEEIKAVYECKNVLEMAAIKEACFNISDEDLRLLDELIISDIKAHEKKDFKSFIEINSRFHLTIVKASKNIFFEKYIHELIERSNVYLIFFDRFMFTPVDNSDAIKGHNRIVKSLINRDVDGCVEAIRVHNQTTLDRLSLNGIIP